MKYETRISGLEVALALYADEKEWSCRVSGSPWKLLFNQSTIDDHGFEIAKQALASVQTRQDTRPYKERFPEQYCVNCSQWMCGGTACCDNPKAPADSIQCDHSEYHTDAVYDIMRVCDFCGHCWVDGAVKNTAGEGQTVDPECDHIHKGRIYAVCKQCGYHSPPEKRGLVPAEQEQTAS